MIDANKYTDYKYQYQLVFLVEAVKLLCEIKMIGVPSGVGGLCVGIFSSLQGWLCVGVLSALQCAKNSVGSCLQSHGCLKVCRMSLG